MTDEPKKPRKKAGPRADAAADAQTKRTDAPKAESRSDDDLREAVLAAALLHAAFDGFTDGLLQKAGAEAGVAKADLTRLFENGAISLVEFYSTHTDAEMEKRLAAM